MFFSQQCYSVLLVTESERFRHIFASLLPSSTFAPILTVPSVSAAQRAALERVYDLVIVNAPLPDDLGAAFAVSQCGNRQTVVLMLVRAAQQEELHSRVSDRGVFTLPKPTTQQALMTAIQWMTAARERLRRVEDTTQTLEQKMQEIRLVNRAKWLLIESRDMSEAEAHRFLEKQAMDRCLPKARIAEELIAADSAFSGRHEAKQQKQETI